MRLGSRCGIEKRPARWKSLAFAGRSRVLLTRVRERLNAGVGASGVPKKPAVGRFYTFLSEGNRRSVGSRLFLPACFPASFTSRQLPPAAARS